MRAALSLAFVLVVAAACAAENSSLYKVVKVVDGDTIHILDTDKNRSKVRLHGIDTPERGQPYWRAAREALADMVAGKKVRVTVVDEDRYGRLVGQVHLTDGTNVNVELVRQGMAWWYERYARGDRQLANAQREAREAGRGLWQEPDPMPPWEWRRR